MVAGDPIRAFTENVYGRLGQSGGDVSPWTKTPPDGVALLRKHLEQTYDVEAKTINELDAGVFRVSLADGTGWIARVFAPVRPLAAVEGDAEVLRFLEAHDFPAERCAHAEAVSSLEGRGVLVTEVVDGTHADSKAETIRRVGELLGRLHSLPSGTGDVARPAGSWHHLSQAGGPRSSDAEILGPLMDVARKRAAPSVEALFDSLRRELDAVDDGDDLPHALIHIDLGGPNVIRTPDDRLVGIDWAGAGRGARIGSLAALMASGGKRKLVNAFVDGYRTHVELEPAELDRLGSAIRAHSLILDCWTMVFAPGFASQVAQGFYGSRRKADDVAALVRDAYRS